MIRKTCLTLITYLALTPSSFAQGNWEQLPTVDSLDAAFSHRLQDPEAYSQTIAERSWMFPEGDLFPIVFPLMAFVNESMADPSLNRRHAAAILAGMAIEVLEVRLGRTVGDIDSLDGEGTYLGQVNLALSAYRLIGGDDRFEPANSHLSAILHREIADRDGAPMDSWPGERWPFDTLVAALSLRVRDVALGTQVHTEIVRSHLEWMDTAGRDPDTGLPASQLDPASHKVIAGSRGCDLSFRIALLSLLDKERAERLYEQYVRHHWKSGALWSGFTEYPDGRPGPVDLDSGPVFDGLGLSATGLGMAATRAAGDVGRWNKLRNQANQLNALIELALTTGSAPIIPPGIELEEGYTTGFLFGDAALFWAATFVDWGVGFPKKE